MLSKLYILNATGCTHFKDLFQFGWVFIPFFYFTVHSIETNMLLLYVYSKGNLIVHFKIVLQQFSVQEHNVPPKSKEELEKQITEFLSEETKKETGKFRQFLKEPGPVDIIVVASEKTTTPTTTTTTTATITTEDATVTNGMYHLTINCLLCH